MKKTWFSTILICTMFLCWSLAAATSQDDIKSSPACKYCGMDRGKFGHSRMLITYDDGSSVGTCSLHCAAKELAIAIDKIPVSIQVADYNSKKLINSEKAIWVLGGDKGGVMTSRAKWAFADREAAEAFIKANNGSIATFDESIKAAYEEMYKDTKAVRERRKMMRMKQQSPEAPK